VGTKQGAAGRAEKEELAMVSLLRRLAWRLDWLRAAPAVALANRSAARAAIERDLTRWRECHDLPAAWSDERALVHLLVEFPEFRNLLEYRTRGDQVLLRALAFRLRKPLETLILDIGELGPGLFIQHGFATIVSAERMGADCWINQQVTVGHVYSRGCPRFGDRVTLAAGAVVVGPISIGDDATIGANTTVVKDVPSGAVVVGPPSRVIERVDIGGPAGGNVDPRTRARTAPAN
jgi:serine O-acetyltransferase